MSSRLRSLLSRIQPAGVILFARNIVSAQQTFRLLKDCQSCVSTPLFTCVDMEGGTVDRFRNVIGASPSATDVFATGDRKLFRKHGAIIGKACRTLGFNTDLAPVVDLALDNSCKVLGSRVVSSDPKQSALYAREFLSGLGTGWRSGSAQTFSWSRRSRSGHTQGTSQCGENLEATVAERSCSLSNLTPRGTDGADQSCCVSRRDSRTNTGFAIEEVDHRHSAKENSVSWPGDL